MRNRRQWNKMGGMSICYDGTDWQTRMTLGYVVQLDGVRVKTWCLCFFHISVRGARDGRRPVNAPIRWIIVKICIDTPSSCRQEDAIALITRDIAGYQVTIVCKAVCSGFPYPGTRTGEFLPFLMGGHAPGVVVTEVRLHAGAQVTGSPFYAKAQIRRTC